MDLLIWLKFLLGIAILMVLARKSLWIALVVSALFIGLFSLDFGSASVIVYDTITDIPIILLALSVGLIAVIGGSMESTGLMNDLVDNLKISRRASLLILPGMLGMLPIPGGALLSAPLIQRAAPRVDRDIKTSVNIWARHTTLLIYPLGSLLATTKMASLDLYTVIIYMIPFFIFSLILIWFTMLRKVESGRESSGPMNVKKLLIPLGVIMSAPLIHMTMIIIFPGVVEEIFLLIAVVVSLGLSIYVGKIRFPSLIRITRYMKAWNFSLIIFGMFIFLYLFKASDIPGEIADLPLGQAPFLVTAGAFLGYATGRINVPISVLIPIFSEKFGEGAIDPLAFSFMFFPVFIGYLISPIHPCVSVSLEYFRTNYLDMLKKAIVPAAISLILTLIAGLILL